MDKTEQKALRAADPSLFAPEEIRDLLEAARAASVAYDRYHASCLRLSIARGVEHVPAEEWDDATRAACDESNRSSDALRDVSQRLFPQTLRAEAWPLYSARFYGTGATASEPERA